MHILPVRNLADARRFAAAYDELCGVVAEPSWVLDAGARLLLDGRGEAIAGYIVDPRTVLSSQLAPRELPDFPEGTHEVSAFWIRDGLRNGQRRQVLRRVLSDASAPGAPIIAVAVSRPTGRILGEIFPVTLYEGPSCHGEVPWMQIRTLQPSRAFMARLSTTTVGRLMDIFRGREPGREPGRELSGKLA